MFYGIDTDELRTTASELDGRAAELLSLASSVGDVLATHDYWSARTTVLNTLLGASTWGDRWVASLVDRAERVDAMTWEALGHRPFPTDTESYTYVTTGTELTFESWQRKQLEIHETQDQAEWDGVLRMLAAIAAIGADADPDAVAAFFGGLSDEQIAELVDLYPDVIGPMPGAPLEWRVKANRQLIVETYNDLQAELDHLLEGNIEKVSDLERIRDLKAELPILEGFLDPSRQFVLFDWEGDGRVAEWHGSLHADFVAMYVPGTGHSKLTVDGLNDRSLKMLEFDPTGGHLAVVTTMVYDAPDELWNAASMDYAQAGAPEIVTFIDGLNLDDRHVTVLAHSYGSVVVGEALRNGLDDVLSDTDDIIVIGSPGIGYDHVSDIPHPQDHIWVGLTEGDEIQGAINLGELFGNVLCEVGKIIYPTDAGCGSPSEHLAHGSNTANDAFGAMEFETGPDLELDGYEHGDYWGTIDDEASESLLNLVRIATGDYVNVTLNTP